MYGRGDSPPPSAWGMDLSTPPPSPPRSAKSSFALVDSFTATPFAGNPAAVVLLPAFGTFPGDTVLQAMAAEFNQSETAFTYRRADGPGYALRWFTPIAEVDLCGHATLGAAHALVTLQGAQLPLTFHTRSGPLTVRRDPIGAVLLELDFPATPPSETPSAAAGVLVGMLAAAGVPQPLWLGRCDTGDTIVVLADEAAVRALAPSGPALAAIGGRGVVVTAAAAPGGEVDFVSRAFFPLLGILEDPVTGSAHTALAPFWSARLGKTQLVGHQVSARGGKVMCRLDAEKPGRVYMLGDAAMICHGEVDVNM